MRNAIERETWEGYADHLINKALEALRAMKPEEK